MMNKRWFRLSALVLALVMLFAAVPAVVAQRDQCQHIPGRRLHYNHRTFISAKRIMGHCLQFHIQRSHQTVPDIFLFL